MADAPPANTPPANTPSANTPPAGDPPPPMVKVTLPGGVQVELPKAQAETVLAAQTKSNAERESLAQAAGAAKAERDAAAARAAAEAADKEAMRLAKDGEVAKARELLTRESHAKLATIGARLRDQAVESAVRAACPGLDAAAVSDMVALVRNRAAFNADTGTVDVLGEDGTPLQVEGKPAGLDRYLADWLKARPHFQVAHVPNPGGATPPGGPVAVGTIRLADLPNLTIQQAADLKAGKLRVID